MGNALSVISKYGVCDTLEVTYGFLRGMTSRILKQIGSRCISYKFHIRLNSSGIIVNVFGARQSGGQVTTL